MPGSNGVSEFLDYARGDPNLTAWEEHFLAGLAANHLRYAERLRLSPKQADVVEAISAKLAGAAGGISCEDEGGEEPQEDESEAAIQPGTFFDDDEELGRPAARANPVSDLMRATLWEEPKPAKKTRGKTDKTKAPAVPAAAPCSARIGRGDREDGRIGPSAAGVGNGQDDLFGLFARSAQETAGK